MGSMIENIGDFDGDGEITGKDLDIMWAYLQTKVHYRVGMEENLEILSKPISVLIYLQSVR